MGVLAGGVLAESCYTSVGAGIAFINPRLFAAVACRNRLSNQSHNVWDPRSSRHLGRCDGL